MATPDFAAAFLPLWQWRPALVPATLCGAGMTRERHMVSSRISALALALCLAAAPAALLAQAAEGDDASAWAPEGAAPEPGAGTVDAGPAGDLSLGVEEGAAESRTYVAASFEAWEQRCFRSDTGADPCQLYTLLKDADGNSVAELSVFNLPEGAPGPAIAGAELVVPLGTLLTEGARIAIDQAKARVYPYTLCVENGCIARIGLTAEDLAAFKKGASATTTIVPFFAPDQPVSLPVSLKGFTAGYDAMAEANRKADAAAKAAGTTPEGTAPEAAPAP